MVKKKHNPTWEHFKLLVFVLLLCELVLFLIALIFGRVFGYRLTLATCFWFGVIVGLCYAMIVGANLGVIFFQMLYSKIRTRVKEQESS
ncbi:MAG: hypothetical protein DRG87_07150 [Deltaproteobacteria bacterium]|nr:hypothetical protein [Deltaproteobacteria bacterium]MBW2312057.1 hypothetical protein [Deltaproteobacteria bacterium]RLB29435.1 MAG: hypothetical protein DRG87_07150 [Deltaproteobacteria bacterium]